MFSTGLCNRFALCLVLVLCGIPLSSNAKQQDPYQKWLNEDVRWIISSQERVEFLKLSTDQERDEFVVAFWNHHNPVGAAENSFKTEHYRRLAYANQHFAANLPGWETDRGHVYIVYGPPDSIDHNEANDSGYPYQIWHYRNIEGRNQKMTVRFVDTCRCGEYIRKDNASEKNLP